MDSMGDNKYRKMYDVFISYSDKDINLVDKIIKLLNKKTISVYTVNNNFFNTDAIKNAISLSRCFIPFITEDYCNSAYCKEVLEVAVNNSINRSKKIIPISFVDMDNISKDVMRRIGHSNIIYIKNNEDIINAVNTIGQEISNRFNKEKLYEILSEYAKIDNKNKKAETISKILTILYSELIDDDNLTFSANNSFMSLEDREHFVALIRNGMKFLEPKEEKIITFRYGLDGNGLRTLEDIGKELECSRERVRQIESKAIKKFKIYIKTKELLKEIYRLYSSLSEYSGIFDDESNQVVREILKSIGPISKMFISKDDIIKKYSMDLLFSSIAIQIIYFDRKIRYECEDVITHGDVSDGIAFFYPVEELIENQRPYVESYASLKDNISNYFDDELEIIKETPKYIVSNKEIKYENKDRKEQEILSEDDKILISIASFMQEGNKLFDVLQQNKIEGSFLRCLLTSYERLKAYCDIVGATKISTECIKRISEIKSIVEKQDNNSNSDSKAEKGIKSLLGFTLADSGDYDVFISFKNEDSDLADQIYNYCLEQLVQPFYSKKTLPELGDTEYAKAINNALRKSKRFVVVFSKLDYLKSKWVEYEMEVFHNEIIDRRKDKGSFLLVVTDDVYDYIMKDNKECLAVEYRRFEIIKMSEFKFKAANYLKNNR